MKNILVLFIAITAFSTLAFAQPKTVTDYYLAMPDTEEFSFYRNAETTDKAALIKFRKSLIAMEDLKNGFLKLEGTWEGWAEIALFKKTDGSYLIAEMRADCGPGCEGHLRFFTYKNSKWNDVTYDYLPKYGEIAMAFNQKRPKGTRAANVAGDDTEGFSFLYQLPRVGRSIKISCGMCIPKQNDPNDQFIFAEYIWNGAKFIKK